jgi:CheY-like chemotaxis protein
MDHPIRKCQILELAEFSAVIHRFCKAAHQDNRDDVISSLSRFSGRSCVQYRFHSQFVKLHTLLVGGALIVAVVFNADAQTLRTGGTGSALEIIRLTANAFAKQGSTQAVLTFVPNLGSSGAMRAIKAGAADVALAEDHPVNQEVARPILKDAGCWATVTVKGRKEVEETLIEPFALVLKDGQRPALNGLGALRHIRARKAAGNVRVSMVALSAMAMTGDREHCLATPLAHKVIKLSVGESAKALAEIEHAAAVADTQALSYAAYTQKSSADPVGGSALLSIAKELEIRAIARDAVALTGHPAQLRLPYECFYSEPVIRTLLLPDSFERNAVCKLST